jgi:dTDP-4-dehydrorhamnose reductase
VRVAVTGANGLIGEAAVAALRGHDVFALGRGASRLPVAAAQWIACDLGDGRSVESALRELRPDAVLHAGAATDVDGCERDPALAWRVNVEGTAQVARACAATGARLVAVSTDYVFDGEAGPYGEDDLPAPRGVYARTKRCGEEAALLLAHDRAVARVAAVYSGRPAAKPTFATQIVERLSRGETVRAFGDQHVSTTLAASGAAMCLELLLETSYQGVLHASDAGVQSRAEFARAIARVFGLPNRIVPVSLAEARLPAPRPARGGLRVDRAARLLRTKPLPLAQALERFHEEWRQRGPP